MVQLDNLLIEEDANEWPFLQQPVCVHNLGPIGQDYT